MGRALFWAAAAWLSALARAAAGGEVDAARIAADPGAYAGASVTVAVSFGRIDNGREPWEEQGDLKMSRVVKFSTPSLGGMRCYAKRTARNMDALTGLAKGERLILTGAVKRCRPAVRAEYDVAGGGAGRGRPGGRRRRGGGHDRDQTEYGEARWVFMADSVSGGE